MKKILKIILSVMILLFAFNNVTFAQNEVKFIYIHGTNDNSEAKKNEFTEDVHRLHAELIKSFNNNATIKKNILEDGKYTISEEPVVFYWGAESKKDLNLLADWLDITKFFSPKLAQTVRSMIAHSFHDAIWIQKYNNMKPVLNKVHEIALQAETDGDKYILLGHSAGTFITYEYFLYKLPFLDTKNFLNDKNIPQSELSQIQKMGYKTTCIDAMIDSGLLVYKRDNTFFVPKENIVEHYKELDKVANKVCILPENMAGVINFGSPLTLFYSGFGENSDVVLEEITVSILKNNLFFLNLNFAEDPLGFPTSSEDDYSTILEIKQNNTITNNNQESTCPVTYGFIYDKSNIRSNRTLINAHMGYWRKAKFFAKEVAKAYEEGFNLMNSNKN